jgi:hypothetical protein
VCSVKGLMDTSCNFLNLLVTNHQYFKIASMHELKSFLAALISVNLCPYIFCRSLLLVGPKYLTEHTCIVLYRSFSWMLIYNSRYCNLIFGIYCRKRANGTIKNYF